MSSSMMTAGATQHLQGLVARKSASTEPKTHAQYFIHVADVVRANDDLTLLRAYNLKRRRQVSYQGYEAVLNRKKRSTIKSTTNGGAASTLFARIAVSNANANVAAAAAALAASASGISPFQATTTASRPASAAKSPKPILAATAAPPTIAPAPAAPVPTPAPIPAAVAKPQNPVPTGTIPPPVIAHVHARAQQQQRQVQHAAQSHPAPVQVQVPVAPKRSDFVVGTSVLIRHTADLVACGARNLAGKTGRIVSAPQLYGQELYSVYIDEHETVFQVPFNALTLVRQPIAAHHQQNMMKPNPAALIPGIIPSAQMATSNPSLRPSPTLEQIKMEHSVQLHRLMQQQYREIQVLQQRYAECRLVNPAALTSIQNELSKLRLVHLSQVQTLKSKQALDVLGK